MNLPKLVIPTAGMLIYETERVVWSIDAVLSKNKISYEGHHRCQKGFTGKKTTKT
jgi:hypothetical protein